MAIWRKADGTAEASAQHPSRLQISAENEEVRLALKDRAEELVSYLRNEAPNRRYPCKKGERRWGRKGGFSMYVQGPYKGSWKDWDSGASGGVFDLFQEYQGISEFAEQVRCGRGWLGWPVDGPIPITKTSDQRRREQAQKIAKQAAEDAQDRLDKIARAQKIWTQCKPAPGTIAEAYLKHTRQIPIETWPETVRFNPTLQALVVGGTSETGEVLAVQCVYLSSEGKKRTHTTTHFSGEKQSFGPVSEAPMRLPGKHDQPLCLAEGPETGLTVWSATGLETWVTLGKGNLPKLTLPKGRKIIVLRDDDPRDAKSHQALKKTLSEWKKTGFDVVSAWPWEVRRGDKSDFNDVIKEAGAEAVRERVALVLDEQPVMALLQVPLDQARLTLERIVSEFVSAAQQWNDGPAPVHAVSVTLGTGKTHAAITHILRMVHQLRAQGDNRAIVFASPEHGLNAEVAQRIMSHAEANGLKVAIWRGRESRLPGGLNDEKMCGDIETIREAQALRVRADEVCSECRLAASCAYLNQRQELDADIWLVAHPMIHQDAPKPMRDRGVAALIVDEAAWAAGLIGETGKGILIPLDALDPGHYPVPKGLEGERLIVSRMLLKKALSGQPEGPVKPSMLKAVGFDEETGSASHRAEWARKVDDGPWRDRTDNKSIGPMTMLWQAVTSLMSQKDDEGSGWLSLDRTEDGALALRVSGRREIAKIWQVPTLLIDANLKEKLVRHCWPTVEVRGRIEVETRHQIIRQVVHPFSKDMLAPREKSDPSYETRRAKSRRKVAAFIMQEDRKHDGMTLVVSNKATIEALDLPPHIQTAHFNAVAGKDQWREARLIIVIGRTQPSPVAVERMAGALTGRAPVTVPKGKSGRPAFYPLEDVYRLQAVSGGVQRVSGEAHRHPDEIAEEIRAHVCEGEVMQAIGRGRGVDRTAEKPLEVIVLSDAVLPVPVHEFMSLDEVLKQSAQNEMLALGGVAYQEAKAAMTAYPDLWPSYEAAKKAIQRKNSGTFWYKEYLVPECPPDRVVEVAYQLTGPKRHMSRATVDLRINPDPRAALEAALGPLAFFEIIEAQTQPVTADVIEFSEHSRVKGEASQTPPTVDPQPGAALVSQGASLVDLDRLRLAVRDGGVRLGDIAKEMGVSAAHLSNRMAGRRRFTPEMDARLAEIAANIQPIQGRLF